MIPAKEENNPARSTVSDILLRSSGRLTVEIEVEGMLHNYHWCEEVWNFVDRSGTWYYDVKWREATLTDAELTVESDSNTVG